MIKITPNTDSVDISQKCVGLSATRSTYPTDVRDHINADRGLHIQIRHNGDPQTFAQASSIARLIAAAPDLLEALKFSLKEWIQYDVANEPGGSMDKARKKAIKLAEKAITKAEGPK